MNLEGSRTEKARGLALVVLSTVAYGTMPILAKITYSSGVGPAGLLAWRFLLAAGLFALLSRGERPLPFRTRLLLWGVSCVFAANSFAYFRALETLPASRVALLFYVYPVIVTLLSAAMGLEAFTLRGLIAATLAVLGTAFTARGPGGGGSAQGVLFALSAAFCYALFIILVSRFAAGVSPRAAARHVTQLAAAVFGGWAIIRGEWALSWEPRAWGAILSMAVVSTVVAHQAFLAGLARVGPARAAVASSLEVIVTVILAVVFLSEAITPRQWLGGAAILSAVVLQNVGRLSGRFWEGRP